MNNIREIISLRTNLNASEKITKIRGKCAKIENHFDGIFMSFDYQSMRYDFDVCKNCHNIMHNSCRSKKYCILCISWQKSSESVKMCKMCNQYTKQIVEKICYECNKIMVSPCVICNSANNIGYYSDDETNNMYCGDCWEKI